MPGEALRKRTAAKLPELIGTTSDDLSVVFPPRDNPLSFFGADAAAAKAVYFANGDPATAIKNIAVDITMHEPARFVAAQVIVAGLDLSSRQNRQGFVSTIHKWCATS